MQFAICNNTHYKCIFLQIFNPITEILGGNSVLFVDGRWVNVKLEKMETALVNCGIAISVRREGWIWRGGVLGE